MWSLVSRICVEYKCSWFLVGVTITMMLLLSLLTLIENLILSLKYNQGSQNVLYVVLLSSVFWVVNVVSCPYQWSHCWIFVLIMSWLFFIGNYSYSLSNHFLSFLFKSHCFCLLLLSCPNLHTKLASSSSGFQNCLRLWILFFLSQLVIWSPCPGWQLYSLFSSHVLSCCFPLCSRIFQCQILPCFITTETSEAYCVEYSMRYICI